MINKIRKAIVGGLLGTTAMTLVLFGSPLVGIPKLSPPQLLSTMLGLSIIDGWLLHFLIGIIFAMMYVFVIRMLLKKVSNVMWKGTIFGVFAFIFGQIMISILGTLFTEAPPMAGSMISMMMMSLLGHLTFGIVVALYTNE
jgi:uncharacterized membrane protein YagU involved in acid resistance